MPVGEDMSLWSAGAFRELGAGRWLQVRKLIFLHGTERSRYGTALLSGVIGRYLGM